MVKPCTAPARDDDHGASHGLDVLAVDGERRGAFEHDERLVVRVRMRARPIALLPVHDEERDGRAVALAEEAPAASGGRRADLVEGNDLRVGHIERIGAWRGTSSAWRKRGGSPCARSSSTARRDNVLDTVRQPRLPPARPDRDRRDAAGARLCSRARPASTRPSSTACSGRSASSSSSTRSSTRWRTCRCSGRACGATRVRQARAAPVASRLPAAQRAFRRYVLRELDRRGPLLSRELEDRSVDGARAHRW